MGVGAMMNVLPGSGSVRYVAVRVVLRGSSYSEPFCRCSWHVPIVHDGQVLSFLVDSFGDRFIDTDERARNDSLRACDQPSTLHVQRAVCLSGWVDPTIETDRSGDRSSRPATTTDTAAHAVLFEDRPSDVSLSRNQARPR